MAPSTSNTEPCVYDELDMSPRYIVCGVFLADVNDIDIISDNWYP